MNALLIQVDLSSLEEIRGGVYVSSNPFLCYLGGLHHYVNSSYHVCVDDTGRRDPNLCCKLTSVDELQLSFDWLDR